MKITLAAIAACALLLAADRSDAATITLDFEELALTTDVTFFTPYQHSGFTLAAVIPATGSAAGSTAHGPSSIFFAGSQALTALPPPTGGPANLITLTRDGGLAFDITSIDLARNFPFDPAPSVTFTGTKVGGTTVTQTFQVNIPVGIHTFQTFTFTGFTDLVSLQWGQPPLSAGLHQFDDITLTAADVSTAPEPASILLAGIALGAGALRRARARLRRASS